MFNYYDVNIIPIILNRFKVNNIILSGFLEEETMDQVLKYCGDNNCSYNNIFSQNESILVSIQKLMNYDAIFLNDDPNWYTVFNELQIIKEHNVEFPLVFICHNIFPHKRRDSYRNPEIIPNEFCKEFSMNLNYGDITVQDGFFHAIEENTSKNGVLTAIEDFLNENTSIEIMNIKLVNGITILYPQNNISYIRINKIIDEIEGYEVDYEELSDSLFENKLLVNYLLDEGVVDWDILEDIKNELHQKEKIIEDYENKVKIHDDELNYKNSQLNNIDSKLSLQDAKIKNIESKLINKEFEINNLNSKLQNANNEIISLKTNISENKKLESELNSEIKNNIAQLNYKDNILNEKNNQIIIKQNKLKEKENQLNLIKRKYTRQLSKLDNKEYCISCYKNVISNNHFEIEYLKKDTFSRKIFNPLSYIYLIFKSDLFELYLNFKLYKALKNSECFDIGYYLNNNKDLIDSMWCKYFSPELHYVCKGFDEERKFNKKFFNIHSKKELLNRIINDS